MNNDFFIAINNQLFDDRIYAWVWSHESRSTDWTLTKLLPKF